MLEHNNTCINCSMSDTNDYESLWCDKIGGKVRWYSDGDCEDFYDIKNNCYPKNKPKSKNKRKLNHYKRKQINKQKLIKLYKISGYGVVYYKEDEDRYIRVYESGRKGFAKWCSKRKVRNSNNFSLKGNGYRKCFDYWNAIW